MEDNQYSQTSLKTEKEIWRGSSVDWLAPKNFGEHRIHIRRGGRKFNPKEYIDYKWRGCSVGWLAPKNFGERRIHIRRGGRSGPIRGGREFNPKEYADYKWRGSSVG